MGRSLRHAGIYHCGGREVSGSFHTLGHLMLRGILASKMLMVIIALVCKTWTEVELIKGKFLKPEHLCSGLLVWG